MLSFKELKQLKYCYVPCGKGVKRAKIKYINNDREIVELEDDFGEKFEKTFLLTFSSLQHYVNQEFSHQIELMRNKEFEKHGF